MNEVCLDSIDIAYIIPGYHDIRYDFENAPIQQNGNLHWFDFTVPANDGDLYITI